MSNFMFIVLDSAVKGSIIILFTLLLCKFSKKAAAEVKHYAMLLSIISLFIFPLISTFTDFLRVAFFKLTLSSSTPAYTMITGESIKSTVVEKYHLTRAIPEGSNLGSYLFIIYALGIFVILLGVLVGIIGSQLIIKKAHFVADDSISNLLIEIKEKLNIRKNVKVKFIKHIFSPITAGYFRPTVILPEEALQWSKERLRIVLTHELSHVRRKDNIIQIALKIIGAIYWFNPLLWITLKKLHIQREICCDNSVLKIGVKPYIYAENIVDMARSFKKVPISYSLVSSIGGITTIESRIMNILDKNNKKIAMRFKSAVKVSLLLIMGLLLMSLINIALTENSSIPSLNPFSYDNNNALIAGKTQNGNGINISKIGGCLPVVADADGTIIEVSPEGYIVLQHKYGFVSTYGNIIEPFVKVGDVISKGTPIGYSREEQDLYYEVKLDSKYLQPEKLIKN